MNAKANATPSDDAEVSAGSAKGTVAIAGGAVPATMLPPSGTSSVAARCPAKPRLLVMTPATRANSPTR